MADIRNLLSLGSQKYDKFLLCGDFNSEDSESSLSEFLLKYDLKNLVTEKSYFKNLQNSRCIDPVLTNSIQIYFNTSAFVTGVPDFQKIILIVMETSYPKSVTKKII